MTALIQNLSVMANVTLNPSQNFCTYYYTESLDPFFGLAVIVASLLAIIFYVLFMWQREKYEKEKRVSSMRDVQSANSESH